VTVQRRWAIAAAATVVIWCGLELAVRRQTSITDDWMGWRQADTQAIARNLAFEEFNPLKPRIDWRGDGPGYVETELQLYPTLIALAMRTAGESVWPGQLISLLASALAAATLFVALAPRFGGAAGYAALLTTLSCQGVVVSATSIQPDPLAFLAFTIGFVTFVSWLETPTRRLLLTWIAATAIAGLVKPTTLELGIAQAVVVLLAHRDALRRPALWAGWAIVLVLVIAFLAYARSLYIAYGNTFGVLSGGDSKLPTIVALLQPRTWIDLARFLVIWGIGVPGALAALFLAMRRRIGAEEAALAGGALVLSLLALRYAAGQFGTHYHLPHIVLGAWLVARAIAQLQRPYLLRAAVVVIGLACAFLYARAVRYIHTLPPEPETVVGQLLASVAAPGTLVAVRARAPRFDAGWNTVNNFEDPRVFYLSRTKGWLIANDEAGAARLAELAGRGARFYAHVNQIAPDRALTAWLAVNAERVASAPQGEVYRIEAGSAR
jgi:hypothetical protein